MAERGLHADIAALIRADDTGGGGDEQLGLDLFDDFASPVEEQLARRAMPVRRGPGRPEGAKTRANMDLVRLLKATRRPTILALKEWSELTLEEFGEATGITKPEPRFTAYLRVLELMTAYEEGRPTARVEVSGAGGAPLPVVIFGDPPVRPDLVDGNAPDDQVIDAVEWSDVSKNDMETGQGSQSKAHDDDESLMWPDPEA